MLQLCECKQCDYDDLEGLRCTKIVQAYRCTMGQVCGKYAGDCGKYA